MTIQKTNELGYWECSGWVRGEFFLAIGKSQLDALNNCFDNIYWKQGK